MNEPASPSTSSGMITGLNRLAYLGPPGTFSQAAALSYLEAFQTELGSTTPVSLVPYQHIEDVLTAVARQEVEEGVVPLENSLEGSVALVLDYLRDEPRLRLRAEIVVPVEQALMGLPTTVWERIRRVISHPQALAQCRYYLRTHLPQAEWVTSSSTAAAAASVAQAGDPTQVAIAPHVAAAVHGLTILRAPVQDRANNATRFVIVGRTDRPPTGRDKTSLILRPGVDRPGLLHALLGEFARYGINLSRIESRPARRRLGEYDFFIDCAGHRLEPPLCWALASLAHQEVRVQVLGSYPQWPLAKTEAGAVGRPAVGDSRTAVGEATQAAEEGEGDGEDNSG